MTKKLREIFVTLPSFFWLSLFFAIPALIVLSFTFHGHTIDGGVGELSLSTWRELVDPDYPVIVWKTIYISVEVTLLCILLALPCAYAIARMKAKWRAIVAGAIMLPFWTSFMARIFAWKLMLESTFPSVVDSETAVVIVSVYTLLPFAIMPLYTAAEKFDFSLMEAARDLGAESFYAFRKIFIPGIRQGLISAVLMVFIPAIGSYVIPQMLGGKNCVLIGNKIFMRAIRNRNIPHASALATLMAVSVFLPLVCALWWRRHQAARDKKQDEIRAARLMVGGMK